MARASGIDMRQFQLQLVKEIRKGVLGGAAGAMSEAAATAAALGAQIGNRRDIAETHQILAASMREAIRHAYQTNVEARKTHSDYGPREGSPSRLQGVLWAALKSETMCSGDARGIALGDDQLLAGAAKHLYRLQFGTRGEGERGEPARDYPITLFGDRLFDVGLIDDPRPGFSLPPGLFLGSSGATGGGGKPLWYAPSVARRGTDIYFPLRGARMDPIKARAIEARRFLDAGLEDLSEKFPGAYNRLVSGWLDRNTRAGQIVVQVRNGRPSNLGKVK